RLEDAAPGDSLRTPHEKALSAIKLMNSTDALDHLRALARFDEADNIYRGVYRSREQPDGLHQELQVLRANAALEVAADALRALRSRGLDEAEASRENSIIVLRGRRDEQRAWGKFD